MRSEMRQPLAKVVLVTPESQLSMTIVSPASEPMQESRPSGTPSASENQPMAVIGWRVRSIPCGRSALIAGSISRFGVAETSKCEMDEPEATGFGAYSRALPDGFAPARTERSRPNVTLTVPLPRAALMALPSGSMMRTDGMVTVGSAPPRPAGGLPGALSATRTAIAPASWAFFTLTGEAPGPRQD